MPEILIETPERAEQLGRRLLAARRLALDTEADGFNAYRPRLCLLQLAWEFEGRIECALVDPLAGPNLLEPLRGILEEAGREAIVHGADYDVRLLKRDAGIAPRGLWDTQRAAQLAGETRTGLAALAARYAGVTLDKRAQRTDWSRRPLPARAIEYALEDVRVLFPMRDALGARLAALGRLDWQAEECRRLEEVTPAEASMPGVEELLERTRGARRLSPAERAVLAELLAWREREAESRGVPAIHVAPVEPLVALAQQRDPGAPDFAAAAVPPAVVRRYGRQLLDAVLRGRAGPPRPAPPFEGPPRLPGAIRRRFELLRSARDQVAKELGLDGSLLGTSDLLRQAAAAPPVDEEGWIRLGLRRWQALALAGAFREALANAEGGDRTER